MNTKGIKFLAVLAVLAMAFAAFAVMADTEQNSAAIPEEVKTVSTESDFRAAITGTEEFNVKLDADIVIDSAAASAYWVKSAGVIDFNGHTITVNVVMGAAGSSASTLTGNDNGENSVIVNDSKGLTLKDTSEDGKGGIINASKANNHNAVLFNTPSGVMTIESGNYTVDNGKVKYGEVSSTASYWYTVKNLGKMTINGGYIAGMNHWWSTPVSGTDQPISSLLANGYYSGTSTAPAATLVINGGTFEFGGYVKNDDCSVATINGGTIKNGLNGGVFNVGTMTINSATFEGAKTDIQNLIADATVNKGEMYIGCDLNLTYLSNSGTITIGDSAVVNVEKIGTPAYGQAVNGVFKVETAELNFAERTTVPACKFEFVDEYNDTHSFQSSAALEVGMGGFTISSGENKLVVDGTVTLTTATTYTCTGNVTLSGMVYTLPTATPTAATGVNLTLVNETKDPKDATGATKMPADIKLGNFQVTDNTATPGSVILNSSVLVEAGCSFYVAGALTIGTAASGTGDDAVAGSAAILKIAEGAVVKPEGDLTIANGGIWNAGQFIAKDYKSGQYDTQLIRVFMNTGYQTGTFYQGASIYDGTAPATINDTVGQTPLTVAFGAYLDMTGIDKVNLTSGGINVNSGLYKYNTLILATFDNTIALTASYDNQYPVTVTLDGKASATPVMTAKSATFRNVVWQSPISATIFVTAPEVYTVILAETLKDQTAEEKAAGAPREAATVWTEGLTITAQDGRVIPIAADGTIKVVFGYEYTIVGANSTSNYKFISPNNDIKELTKLDKTKGKFTMIRDNLTPTTPVVLQVTEGLATELTVYLDDEYQKFAEGDVFMYYAVADDKGKAIGNGTPVTVQIVDREPVGIIKDIYSNDTLLFKSEFVKFFVSIADSTLTTRENVLFPGETTTPVATTDEVVLDSENWSKGFTFVAPEATATSMEASFTLVCTPYTIDVTFIFGNNTVDSQQITVEFTEYSGLTDIHKEIESKTKNKADDIVIPGTNPQQTVKGFTIEMCVGEVFKVTWTDVDNYISKMTYSKNIVAAQTDEEYSMGTNVTVKGDMATYYTLTEEELRYIIVENKTNYDLTLTIGKFSADIASKGTNNKVITNDDKNTLVLSKKGWTVEGWTFEVYTDTTTTAEPVKTVYVSGPQTTDTYLGIKGANDVKKITITQADVTMTRYFVNVESDDHGAIDPFDQTGYMGETRKAYVTTQYGYNVVDVIYEYQEVDMTEKAYGHATKGTTPEGQEVWTYTMPASNVLLKPIIEKETRDLSFVDQNGELLEPAQKVAPRTEVNMPVPCKPLSEIVSVTTESQIEYEYVPETGYISFVMPDEDVVFVVTCQEIDYSKDVIVTIGQKANAKAITLVITALDGKQIASGSITMYVNYTYVEDGEVWTDAVKVTVDYVADGSAYAVKNVDSFVADLGDNYSGAFAVTGSFEFGYAEGNMSKTVYTPVLGA